MSAQIRNTLAKVIVEENFKLIAATKFHDIKFI